ncbi:transcriptional regulator domain-containing protein [Novosphingobium sp. Rr 2-17]|uniref:transcriptional regulator domain-containing protein n=1 Tax=Novosphingobium sp. Rr 2-17 TaxID=555793 RepID=UPI003FCFA7D2
MFRDAGAPLMTARRFSRGVNWRDTSPYDDLSGVDRAGLMWEWLRRDPAYVEWYACASGVTRSGSCGEVVRQWGLHFPRGPRGHRFARQAYLVFAARPGRLGSRCPSSRWGRHRCHRPGLAPTVVIARVW